MKRKLFIVLLSIVALLSLVFGVTACLDYSESGNNIEQTTPDDDTGSVNDSNSDSDETGGSDSGSGSSNITEQTTPDDDTGSVNDSNLDSDETNSSDDGSESSNNTEQTTPNNDISDINSLKQSEGLEIVDGVIVGIGTCTDSVLILNMPVAAYSFIGCDTITMVIFGPGVTSIGYQAFGNSGTGCANLTVAIFTTAVPPDIASDIFGSTWNHSAGFIVYVPEGSLELYEAIEDTYWQQYLVSKGLIVEYTDISDLI